MLLKTVAARLGAQILSHRHVGGGDINEALALNLSDGRTVFLKYNDRAPASMFEVEALGLAWLGEAKIEDLRVPRALAYSPAGAPQPNFLVLEYVANGAASAVAQERLGRGLAQLHRTAPGRFGWSADNFIGTLHQVNVGCDSWAGFYGSRRLEPQVSRAVDSGLIPDRTRREFDRLLARLDQSVGPKEPPARLHGDLWAGNVLYDSSDYPVLIDPAVYAGHREVDLAMMRLFGGFSELTFSAYSEVSPLADGSEERVCLYQLYPLLVHLNLFGAGYLGRVEHALSRCP